MTYKRNRGPKVIYGCFMAAGLFLAGPGTANAASLTFCGVTAPAGQSTVTVAARVVPGGGTVSGTATEIDQPSFHEIRLSPLTITCLPADVVAPALNCQGALIITGTYQSFIGPGTDSVTLDGTLTTFPLGPPPPFLSRGETIFESGQGTTFDNNAAVVFGTNQLLGPVSPFFFTQTKEGNYSGAGLHIVGFSYSLAPNEQYVFASSVVGDLEVAAEPSTWLLVSGAGLVLVGCARRRWLP